ncbi:hypothetical protein J7L13_01875 [bacterium]|nr:hypothetical protein [bacterium]
MPEYIICFEKDGEEMCTSTTDLKRAYDLVSRCLTEGYRVSIEAYGV